jgi:hypothetical protein
MYVFAHKCNCFVSYCGSNGEHPKILQPFDIVGSPGCHSDVQCTSIAIVFLFMWLESSFLNMLLITWRNNNFLMKSSACNLLHTGFLFILLSWRWRRLVFPKRWLTFIGLYGCISQKVEPFITTAVRASNPTCNFLTWTLILQRSSALYYDSDKKTKNIKLSLCLTN